MNAAIDLPQPGTQAGWPADVPIPLAHVLVPDSVRKAVLKAAPAGRLYRVKTSGNVEWWLMDRHDELIDIFWQSMTSSIVKISAQVDGEGQPGLEDIRFSRWL